jgi:hypothetical protein
MSNRPNFGKRKRLLDAENQVKSLIDLSFSFADNTNEALHNLSALLDQFQIPGGCEECDAYQTVPEQDPNSNIMHVNVVHDDDCPRLERIKNSQIA